jgi:hypothetical protein
MLQRQKIYGQDTVYNRLSDKKWVSSIQSTFIVNVSIVKQGMTDNGQDKQNAHKEEFTRLQMDTWFYYELSLGWWTAQQLVASAH